MIKKIISGVGLFFLFLFICIFMLASLKLQNYISLLSIFIFFGGIIFAYFGVKFIFKDNNETNNKKLVNNTKKIRPYWIIIIILLALIVLFDSMPLDNAQQIENNNKVTKITKKDSLKEKNNLTNKEKQTILKIVKSESKVQDAIFPNDIDNLLYVAMYNDGTNRSGFAEYLCISIKNKVKLPHQIYIEIMDYQYILQQKGFKKMGGYICNP